MVQQLSYLNPERPREVVLRLLMDSVQPYVSQALGALFHSSGDPLRNLLKFVKRSSGQLAVGAVAAGAAGGATSAVALWKATLGTPRAIAYQLGILSMPLAAPLVGGFMGLALGATGAALLIGRLRDGEMVSLARLHAQLFSALVYAEGMEEPARHRILEELKDRLIGAGLTAEVIEPMFVQAPLRVEDLELQLDDYEPHTLREALTSAWQLTCAAGEPPSGVEQVFARLCRRCNLGDEIEKLKQQAQQALAQQSARISAAITTARHLGADFHSATIDEALDKLVALDPSGTARQRRLRALHVGADVVTAAATIAAVATGKGQILPIIGQAYGALHAAVNGDETASRRLHMRTLELLKQLGIKPEDASRFLAPLLETFDVRRGTAPRGEATA